jgi:hypothetical protein
MLLKQKVYLTALRVHKCFLEIVFIEVTGQLGIGLRFHDFLSNEQKGQN